MEEVDRHLIYFIAKFFIAAIIILPAWYYAGAYYQIVVLALSKPLLFLMGYTEGQISGLQLTNVHLYNFNLVSFFALVIATPLKVERKIRMLLLGLLALLSVHVIDLVAHFPAYFNNKIAVFIVDAIGVFGLAVPLAVWFLFSYKKVDFLKF